MKRIKLFNGILLIKFFLTSLTHKQEVEGPEKNKS